MSNIQAIVTILAAALATILVRALPFLLFPEGRQTPNYIKYLGNALPCYYWYAGCLLHKISRPINRSSWFA